MPTPVSDDAAPVQLQVDLAWQSVLVALVAVSVLGLLWALVGVASVAVTLIVVALFLAMALDPVVGAIERRFRLGRGIATALVMACATALLAVFVTIAGPQLVQESATLERQLPRTVDQLGELPLIGGAIRDADLSDKLTTLLASLPDHTAGQGAAIGGVVRTVSFGLGAAVMGFFLVTGALYEGPRLIRNVRSAIPAARREAADGVGRVV
ncbi:MAG: AI-2E family transporter, partial [Microthrixaceae bacterium]